MSSPPVVLTRDGAVATLRLNRPDALNAISEDVLAGLRAAVDDVRDDATVKALIVTGSGERAFSVGLDIDLLGRAFTEVDYFADVVHRLKQILLDLERLPVPVVAAVNGLARAGGFELLLACDLVVVAEEARIGDTHVAFGIVPGGGASQRLPRKVGLQRAAEILYSGRWLTGPECVEAGLALRSVPRAELDVAVAALVDPMRALSRPALAGTKAAVLDGLGTPIEEAVEIELAHFLRHLREEPTASEGYRAFVEKRPAVWP